MKKVSKSKIASTYATALYAAADGKHCTEKVWKDVANLADMIAENKEWIAFIANPIASEQDKKDILQTIGKELKLDEETKNWLEVIWENGRFNDFSAIVDEFKHVYYRKNNVVEVEVNTVKTLSSYQNEKLRKNLEKMLNKKVVVTYQVMPELIGGLRIKFGSEMIDNSVLSKLNRLENEMKGVQ